MIRPVVSLPAHLLGWLIRIYQLTLSPLTAGSCRYHPSCSDYAREAVARFGALKGSYLAAARLLRCHPWGGSGVDPVPDAFPDVSPFRLTPKTGRHG